MVNRAQLRDVSLFASLPPVEIDVLAATLQAQTYPPQAVLCREGDIGDRLYIVLDGEVEIIKALGTDDERVLGVARAGEFLGEMSLLSPHAERSASVRASTQTEVLELTRADFEKLLHRYPVLTMTLLQVLIERLRQADNATIRDLQEKNRELAQAYKDLQAAQQQLIQQATLARELQHAQQIQESMLPASLPSLNGVDVGARMVAARQVGGDFFDVLQPTDDRLVVVVGDVSGKGVPAALLMAQVCSLLRVEAYRTVEPEAVLRTVNTQLLSRNLRSMFVTLLYGELDLSSHCFTYVRAGHEHPLLWDGNGAAIAVPQGQSHPLGLFPEPVLEVRQVTLAPGSSLLCFTDGATEAMNGEAELFGHAQLSAAVRKRSGVPAQQLCDHLIQTIHAYQAGAAQMDDITLLALRVTGGA